jgi:hypothetical protein
MQTINIFLKNLRFFTISFSQENDGYVKIYETGQLTLIHVNFANVLWVAYKFVIIMFTHKYMINHAETYF